MRAVHLTARGFRNLADLDLELPPGGAVFLGPNAHGKTSLLECLYYPVLFRSFRAATDSEVTRWDGPGFRLTLEANVTGASRTFSAEFDRAARQKRVQVDGAPVPRITDAVGEWLAVAFLPTDLSLVQGAAVERRRYLDRVLSLADARYLRALIRFRATLAQRNAALRSGNDAVARAFDPQLREPGAYVVQRRHQWVREMAEEFAAECAALGEESRITIRYRGNPALAEEAEWDAALQAAAAQEITRGMSLVGPQRDDLMLECDGRSLRDFGSTGQHRTAAIALKLCELATLRAARRVEPVLLLDDVFSELDRERQQHLAARLGAPAVQQVCVTTPRRDELPPDLELEVFEVTLGRVRPAGVPA
ncbi:MAG TPA: DNA replication and repair protein RecF [Gemmatimonadales bacterium]